jgi:hypothetical protein
MAAKAAYLSNLIKNNKQKIERFGDEKSVIPLTIETPHNTKLNKLKKTNPDAFWYWWKATNINHN